MKPTTVDFETFGIEPRPDYPPAPVGVSIKRWGKLPKYYAWGHLNGRNNCTRDEGVSALRTVWDGDLLFHNARFDLDVAESHLGLLAPKWDAVHDTMFLLYLADPHQRELGLKPAADRLLGMPPDERDVVAEWLLQNQPVPGVRISRSDQGKEPPGKYIAYAPPEVVGPYANGDVERTEALFRHLYPAIVERGMGAAYDRERRLAPILLEMERRGISVDLKGIERDVDAYTRVLDRIDRWIQNNYGISSHVNLDSGAQLVAALNETGLLDIEAMGVTKTGKVATTKAAIADGCRDPALTAVLRYRTQLNTCLNTFMKPWLTTAQRSGGKIFTTWHQTRGAGDGGTRTGRLSSTPNFQNIPKVFKQIFWSQESIDRQYEKIKKASSPEKLEGERKEYQRLMALPRSPIDLPPLPRVRSYVLPYPKQVLCGRDFSSQELRILAHFEDGAMLQQYKDKPDTDFHQFAAELVSQTTGITITRTDAKTIGFAILYGAGVGKLAMQLNCSLEKAKDLLKAYFQVFPGIRVLQNDLKLRSRLKQPLRTIGGREYYCEEPKIIDGKYREFSYKMTNYLIQGSAADQTKDAMIRFTEAAGPGKLLLSVHDEILISVPVKEKIKVMKLLKESMNYTELDVPMLSDGEWGSNWADMVESTV